jgi:hypothetical protein
MAVEERRPPDMEGSCEYTEYGVTGSRQRVVLQLWGWAGGLTTLHQLRGALVTRVTSLADRIELFPYLAGLKTDAVETGWTTLVLNEHCFTRGEIV